MSEHDVLSTDEPSAASPGSRQLAWIAAAVAGVLVAAVGGFALGQSHDSDGDSAPPISLGAAAETFGADSDKGIPGLEGLGAPEIGAGMGIMPIGYGRIVFTAGDLSDEGTTSEAWAYDPDSVFSKDVAASAALVLGMDAEPVMTNGVWTVGSVDGAAPVLQLMPDGFASLSYWNPQGDPYVCAEPMPGTEPDVELDAEPPSGSTNSGGGVEPGAPGMPENRDCPVPDRDSLSDDAAIGQLRDLMEELGVDTSNYEFDVMDYGTPNAVYVVGSQVVEGQQTGATWSATFVGDKVQMLNGGLAPLASLDNYDVVSPSDAVGRLDDPRFGVGGWGGPVPYMGNPMDLQGAAGAMESQLDAYKGTAEDSGSSEESIAMPRQTLPPTMNPGEPFDWPVTEVTITDARLGVAMYTQLDGATVLLPTYQLTGDDDSTWSVVAVADESLNFAEPR